MLRARIQRLADHHAGLRPRVCVLDATDPRHDRALAGERLERKVELIRDPPDIHTRGRHRVDADRTFHEATDRGWKTSEPQR